MFRLAKLRNIFNFRRKTIKKQIYIVTEKGIVCVKSDKEKFVRSENQSKQKKDRIVFWKFQSDSQRAFDTCQSYSSEYGFG